MTRRAAPPLAWVLLLSAGFTLWQIAPFLASCIAGRFLVPTWAGPTPELDAYLIHQGLLRAPRFVDTLGWWTGPWVMQVPFYRPLTSYAFWLEWKLFGEQESLWGIPAAGAHLAATLLFAALVYRLAEKYRVGAPAVAAVAGAWGFAGFLSPYRMDVVSRILVWKNQPDSLAAACCFAALLCYRRAQEGRRGALATAAACYLAACGFKEIAVPLPLVCAVLEPDLWRAPGRGAALRRLAAMAGAAALFLAIRAAAIGGMGYTYGSNKAWLRRTLVHLAGPFAPIVVHGQWLGNLMGVWAFLLGGFFLGQ